ncbi:MAG: MBL fold metallo-hydrolase [Desulfobacter postgatei]|uniref:MBL fold metallo-hydrolase n=1 Tax=Desulfobacter postgatei TaxID=2293 RepID=UPI0023F1DB4F|nr:MBL fold metallo-hydrolase [Desulfobacter postgatei]MDD4274509.1 MBL fold metallo-hydrolase [Desulfobacter postgatei]
MRHTEMIRRITGPYNLNTYFLVCKKTRKAVIIDPGGTVEEIADFIRKNNLIPDKIVLTHGHADQFFSMDAFKEMARIPYCLHRADDDFFKDPEVRIKTKQSVGLPPPHPADIRMNDGDTLVFGCCELAVIHTPGHTPGSVCLLCEDHLFTGDAIFVGEAGRTDLPGGDLPCLIDSIRIKILPLDKKTLIFPGHHRNGDPWWSTLEQEMKTNIYITDFILDES